MKRTPGQIAYEAYCQARGWRAFDKQLLPPWAYVRPEIRAAWEAAGTAVIESEVDSVIP